MSSKKKRLVPVPLGIASVWFATHAGPGAAAGKFSAVYFGSFGKWGLITSALAMLIMALCIYVGIEYSRRKNISSYSDFINSFFAPYNKFFSTLFDITYLFGVLVAAAAGIAAAASAVNLYFNIPYWLVSLFIVAVSILLSLFGSEIVRSASTVMTVTIITLLAMIVFAGMTSPLARFSDHWNATSFSDYSAFDAILHAFLYAGALIAGSVANSISVSNALENQKQAAQSATLGFISNYFLAGGITFLLFAYPQYIQTDLPNYYIVEALGYPILLLAYVIILVLAVISTNVPYAYSAATRYGSYLPMKSEVLRDLTVVIILFGTSYALSLLGLSTIISKGYTYLGYAAIPTVILPLILLGKKKISGIKKPVHNEQSTIKNIKN